MLAAGPSAPSPRPVRPTIVGIGVVVAVVLPGFMAASLAVEIRHDFRLTDAQIGLAVAAAYVVAACTSPLAGRLVDDLGPRRALYASSVLAAVSSLLVALVVDSAAALLAVLMLSGVANALSTPGASALVSSRPDRGHRGLTLGIQQAGAPAGAVLAGLALPAIALPFGWRWAFVAAAAFAVAIGLATRAVTPEPAPIERKAVARRQRQPFGVPHLLAVTASFGNLAASGMVSFLVLYAVEEGLSAAAAGLLLAASSLSAALARAFFGGLADRRPGRALNLIPLLLTLSVLGFGLLAVGGAGAVVMGAIVAGGVGWGWSGLMVLALVEKYTASPSWAVGVGMSGVYVGAGAGPLLTGVIAHEASFETAWLVGAGVTLAAVAAALAARQLDRRTQSGPLGGPLSDQA